MKLDQANRNGLLTHTHPCYNNRYTQNLHKQWLKHEEAVHTTKITQIMIPHTPLTHRSVSVFIHIGTLPWFNARLCLLQLERGAIIQCIVIAKSLFYICVFTLTCAELNVFILVPN